MAGRPGHGGDHALENPLGAVQMGLIYVNPEGPNGNPDPLAAARDTRETFTRMAMDDEETVALIAGGHTFGKTMALAMWRWWGRYRKPPIEQQGLGWKSRFGSGGGDASAAAWKLPGPAPRPMEQQFLLEPFGYDWELTKSPAGAHQWRPVMVPAPIRYRMRLIPQSPRPAMLTTDLALRFDPAYEKISRASTKPDQFAEASPAPGSS